MIYFWAQKNWRQKCLYQDDKLLRQKCINHENIMDVLTAREPILPFRTIKRLLVNNNREIIFREAEPRLFTKVFKYSCLCLPWLKVFMAPQLKLCSENNFQLQAKWDKWRVTDYMRFGWNCIVIIMIISLSSSSSSWSSLMFMIIVIMPWWWLPTIREIPLDSLWLRKRSGLSAARILNHITAIIIIHTSKKRKNLQNCFCSQTNRFRGGKLLQFKM